MLDSIESFFRAEHVLERIPYDSCVLDLILIADHAVRYRVYICEINPLAEFAGTGLFSWLTDRSVLLGETPFQFRIRTEETKEAAQANGHWLSLIDNA